jgi:hypothetical protein
VRAVVRLAAAATAVLLLAGLIVPAATGRAFPGAGAACGKSARECCCGPMRMAPGQHCVKGSCSFQAPNGPSATLSPQREVPGRPAVLAFGAHRIRFLLAGRIAQADPAFPSAPLRLPLLPPPRCLPV